MEHMIGVFGMRIAEKIVQDLSRYLSGKKVLEVACGDSDLSLAASRFAARVLATDISLERAKRIKPEMIPNNVEFREMDAADMEIDDESFDVSVCYNALGHLRSILGLVFAEMLRVTKQDGYLMFVATWKMDIAALNELKEAISEYGHLISLTEISNSKYKALIVKKTTNHTSAVFGKD